MSSIDFASLKEDFTDLGFGASYSLAKRVYDEFRKKYGSPRFWGRIVASEWPEELTGEQEEAIFELIGARLTFRIDMITDMNADDVHRISSKVPGLSLPGPGRYLHDWKTASGITNDLRGTYDYDPQFMAYPHLYNRLSEKPCQGIIAHRITKTATVNFQHWFVPIKQENLDIVASWVQGGELLAQTDLPSGIGTNCEAYFRKCPHLFDGLCDRVWKKGE